jgi:hypothetical protein
MKQVYGSHSEIKMTSDSKQIELLIQQMRQIEEDVVMGVTHRMCENAGGLDNNKEIARSH